MAISFSLVALLLEIRCAVNASLESSKIDMNISHDRIQNIKMGQRHISGSVTN